MNPCDAHKGTSIKGDWCPACTIAELECLRARLALLEKVAEVAEKRPNKMGPHFMIWMDTMDAALRSLKEGR